MSILEKLKVAEEHFENITVEEFEKNIESLGIENYIKNNNKQIEEGEQC